MHLLLALFLLACDGAEAPVAWSPPLPSATPEEDGGQSTGSATDTAGPQDTGAACYPLGAQAYQACVADSQCDPGSACTTVEGFSGKYCSPACDPAGDGSECDPDGTVGEATYCLQSGRCARACGEPDTCPEEMGCQTLDELDGAGVCAGPPSGTSGYYGICSHPNVDGPDCPSESTCFGGDYIGIDDGVCLPWCDDGSCASPPDETEGVSPYCYDAGLDHPICVLFCDPETSTCPSDQYCMSVYGVGLCVPEGTEL